MWPLADLPLGKNLLTHWLLPWVPVLPSSLNGGLWSGNESQINPFLPRLLLGMVFITAKETRTHRILVTPRLWLGYELSPAAVGKSLGYQQMRLSGEIQKLEAEGLARGGPLLWAGLWRHLISDSSLSPPLVCHDGRHSTQPQVQCSTGAPDVQDPWTKPSETTGHNKPFVF